MLVSTHLDRMKARLNYDTVPQGHIAFQIQTLAYVLYSTLIEIAAFSGEDLAAKRRKRYCPNNMSELHNCFYAILAVIVCSIRVNMYDLHCVLQNEKVYILSLCVLWWKC